MDDGEMIIIRMPGSKENEFYAHTAFVCFDFSFVLVLHLIMLFSHLVSVSLTRLFPIIHLI